MGKTAFYIGHGVEARYFLLSGIADEIRKKEEILVLVGDNIISQNLDQYAVRYKLKIVRIPSVWLSKPTNSFDNLIRAIRDARKRNHKLGLYHHFSDNVKGNRIKDFLKGNLLMHYFSDISGRKHLTGKYYDERLAGLLKEANITRLFMLEYSSSDCKTIGSTCASTGTEVHIVINTLKTVFITDFIPFPVTAIHAWNISQQELLIKANPGIEHNKIHGTGSPFHTFLRNSDDEKTIEIRKKYSLHIGRPVIIYSMIFEKVFLNEHLIIKKIHDHFINNYDEQERPLIILRRNPFEENDKGIKFLSELPGIIIAGHYWERDASKNWSIQGIEGELEWRSLLQMADLSMNIPSMSTIDSIMCGTPVVNIGFDENGEENKKIPHIIHAPFVDEFEKSKFVNTFFNYKEFTIRLRDLLSLKSKALPEDIRFSIDISRSPINKFTFKYNK